MATAVLVASGFTCSSAFEVSRSRFALHLPNSTTASQVRVQFAQAMTANSAAFATMQGDNTGSPYLVFSGSGPLVSHPIPTVTPFVRILTSAAMTGPSSYTVLPIV
jgi:hypothetical protein